MSRRDPANSARGWLATRTEGLFQVRLAGPVSCHAYTIGNAVRLGTVTIVIADRMAAVSVATAALMVEDVAKKLGPTYQHRWTQPSTPTTLSALATFKGTQKVGNIELRATSDRCGQASLTLGSVRLTLCDRDAADNVAKALANAYDETGHTFALLRPYADLVADRDRHDLANKARREGIILT